MTGGASLSTVLSRIWWTFALWTLWALASLKYIERLEFQGTFRSEGWEHFVALLALLSLAARAYHAHTRHEDCRNTVTAFFNDLRHFVNLAVLHVRAPQVDGSKKTARAAFDLTCASELRADLLRLAVALAVTMRLQVLMTIGSYVSDFITGFTKWQVDWYRFRLRQLLKDHEFCWVDAALGIEDSSWHESGAPVENLEAQFKDGTIMPPDWPSSFAVDPTPPARPNAVVAFLIREMVFGNINDASSPKPWGIKHRFAPRLLDALASAQMGFERVDSFIVTPLPLVYVSWCRLMVVVYMIIFPLVADVSAGLPLALAMPGAVTLALLGLEALCAELEGPLFGDEAGDIDIAGPIHELEHEALELLCLAEDNAARDFFVWRRSPAFAAPMHARGASRQLALKELAGNEVVPGVDSPASSNRSLARSDEG